jgi:hypothetical protein
MTFILNEYDIEEAQIKAAHEVNRPNLQAAVLTLARLMEWTNANSDGWAYWTKPVTAAKRLQGEIDLRYFQPSPMDEDLSAQNLKRAYTPIKAFLTRQGVDHSVVFVND